MSSRVGSIETLNRTPFDASSLSRLAVVKSRFGSLRKLFLARSNNNRCTYAAKHWQEKARTVFFAHLYPILLRVRL